MTFDFAPMLPTWLLTTAAILTAAGTLYGMVRKARGLFWRGLAILILLGWMSGPRALHPVLRPLPQDALLIVDHSPSMTVRDRSTQADHTAQQLEQEAARLPGLTLHRLDVTTSPSEHGTHLFDAIDHVDLPQGRFAGAIVVTDGMNHDTPAHLPARFHSPNGSTLPLHLILTGKGEETDRRLTILNTPPFAIVGQNATIRVQIDDLGTQTRSPATLTVQTGDSQPTTRSVQTGQPQDITVPVQHPGETLIGLSVSPLNGEASTLNNQDVVRIRGVRDRLRVLLVSGAPNQSERVWRRLLKADPSVDLVHFTILRSPTVDDDTPLSDLALIPFPIRELFQDKIRSFDLIILDGFRNSNILPEEYLTNIADYVRTGGGLLVTAGPEFVQDGSLQDTSLAQVLPAHVSQDGIITRPFRPALTPLGTSHPVTANLGDSQNWGPWYRSAKTDQSHGENLMSGPDGSPLLLLDHVDQGRIAMLMSDQLWLWSRDEKGGGPQAELLRRLSHWLMKEPDLEENRLTAHIENGTLFVERHALGTTNGNAAKVSPQATVISPDGQTHLVPMTSKKTLWHGTLPIQGTGIWTIHQDNLTAFASPPPQDTLERQDLRATATLLHAITMESGGSQTWTASGLPHIRQVAAGQPLSGEGWIGLPVTKAAAAGETRTQDLIPGWVALLLALAFLGIGWWREGR